MGQELSGKVAIVTGGRQRHRTRHRRAVRGGGRQGGHRRRGRRAGRGAGREPLATQLSSSGPTWPTPTRSRTLVDFAVGQFGGLHVMFNNAGIPSSFHRFLQQRLLGLRPGDGGEPVRSRWSGSQRAARHMAEHGGGSIINTSSIGALTGGAFPVTYRTSKAAVIQFSRSIAIDLAEYGIRVNCVAPGPHPHGHHQLRHRFGHPAHPAAAAPRCAAGRRQRRPLPGQRAIGADHRDRGAGGRGDGGRTTGQPAQIAHRAGLEGGEVPAELAIRGGTVFDGTRRARSRRRRGHHRRA